MSDHGKLHEEPRICSPVYPETYLMVRLPQPSPSQEDNLQYVKVPREPRFGVTMLISLAIVAGLWWMLWGWELLK